jgi:hypothetical protein
MQIGVADRSAALVGAESVRKHLVGLELRRTSIELPRMAQHHTGAPAHRPHQAANLHVHVAVFAEFADIFAAWSAVTQGFGAPAKTIAGTASKKTDNRTLRGFEANTMRAFDSMRTVLSVR